jgi:hypothetical protein
VQRSLHLDLFGDPMSKAGGTKRAAVQRHLQEIYCTFSPSRAAEVKELLGAGVAMHTIQSLYPPHFQQLLEEITFPNARSGQKSVLCMVSSYYGVEDSIDEVPGGVYGDAGKEYKALCTTPEYGAVIERVRLQLLDGTHELMSLSHIETAFDCLFWYTWTFESWQKLDRTQRGAFQEAVAGLTRMLREIFGKTYFELPEVTR